MSNFKFVVGVISGAAIGFVAASVYTSKKYDKLIDEEILSVKEAYENACADDILEEEAIIINEETSTVKKDISEYAELAKKYNSEDAGEDDDEEDNHIQFEKIVAPKNPKVYEISEEEYGEMDEFDMIECTLFSDGILADDDDGIIDDAEDIVGSYELEQLDEENPIVYIRNEIKMIDYAIAYDTREYVKAMQSAHRIH